MKTKSDEAMEKEQELLYRRKWEQLRKSPGYLKDYQELEDVKKYSEKKG